MVGPRGVAYVSTPNVLTLAPKGEARSGNPWHVREYRPEEYRALCERHFGSVDLLGLFHARKLRLHQLALERAALGRGPQPAADHEAVLRPLHARDLHARLPARPPRAGRRAGPAGRAAPMSRAPGALAIVLHTHMPYVEGFGTWPFGEEWLWEAIAACYLPLLDVLDGAPGRVTLSVTPVLGDQLEAPGALERCASFLREIRPESHRLDVAAARDPAEAAALEHSAASYARAAAALARGDLPERLAAHASWTSAATHPVLPLLATHGGVRLQLATGIAAHRARSGSWSGGLWLPECAHAPWLDGLLEEAGVRATCLDLTDVLGRGTAAQLRPLRSPAGPLLAPLDRAVIELVWSEAGYPSRGAYRDTHRLTEHHHQAWAVHGGPYEADRAVAQARADAEDFVAHAAARVRDGGLCVVALDTELLGLHWHEGVEWLAAVLAAGRPRGAADRPARRPARGDRARAGARAAADVVGDVARPRHLERSRRGRIGLAPARARSCAPSRRCPACPTARCASCWRCSPPTGRS